MGAHILAVVIIACLVMHWFQLPACLYELTPADLSQFWGPSSGRLLQAHNMISALCAASLHNHQALHLAVLHACRSQYITVDWEGYELLSPLNQIDYNPDPLKRVGGRALCCGPFQLPLCLLVDWLSGCWGLVEQTLLSLWYSEPDLNWQSLLDCLTTCAPAAVAVLQPVNRTRSIGATQSTNYLLAGMLLHQKRKDIDYSDVSAYITCVMS
jgi:hypothetical protein